MTTLVPRTEFDGRELRFDFPGLRIGVAEYDEGPTGCTVFHLPPGGAACAVDVRGGSSGTLGGYEWAHAICLAGGSLYGLEATCGVAAELMAMRGHTVGWEDVELAFGAIIYDFGRRENSIYPDGSSAARRSGPRVTASSRSAPAGPAARRPSARPSPSRRASRPARVAPFARSARRRSRSSLS